MQKRSVWLDCDPGFDDWMAWILLENAARKNLISLTGVSLVHGNTNLQQVVQNAKSIASLMAFKTPMFLGQAHAINGSNETAVSILGESGMRSTGFLLNDIGTDKATPSAHANLPSIDGIGHVDCLIATGPLSNVATQLKTMALNASEVVWMGGSTDRGNHTAAAEFNAFADPEAASEVFNGDAKIRMIGLNICREVMLKQADVAVFKNKGSHRANVFHDHFDGYQKIRSTDGSQAMPLYDPVAIAAVLHPDWFEYTPARVDVECMGKFTRGMTVCEFRLSQPRHADKQQNAWVATDVQADKVKSWVLESIAEYFASLDDTRP